MADAILREPWPRDAKLTMVLLAAWLNQRWARDALTLEEAGKATLSRAALFEITGRAQLVHSRRALSALSEFISLAIGTRGELTEIHWPKFAEFQGLPSGNGPAAAPQPARELPSPRPRPRPRKEEEKNAASAAPSSDPSPGGKKRQRGGRGVPFPEPFPPEWREQLYRWAPSQSFTEPQVDYSILRYGDWAVSTGARRVDHVRGIMGGMRRGWLLEGAPPPTYVPPTQHRTAGETLDDEREAVLRAALERLRQGGGEKFSAAEIEAEAVSHVGETEARRLGLGGLAQ